jgi:photosystem II stability/assembly factor-like uncharacterized protein
MRPRSVIPCGAGAMLITAAVLAGMPATAAQATPHGMRAATSAAQVAVPKKFRANSITWVSAQRGWVLGAAPCGTKTCTDVIATTNGGTTWTLRGRVPARIPRVGEPGTGVSEIRFGTPRIGWSFGPRLYRTGNGGRSWSRKQVPGHGKQILALAATATTTYAVVSPCAFGTGVCHRRGPLSLWRTATRTGRAWTRIPLALPINDFANVSAFGKTAYVVDAQRDVTGRRDKFYASTNNGRHFSARPAPCDSHPGSALAQAVATSATHVTLLCFGPTGPQPGEATKSAYRSANTGKTYTFAGATPVAGATIQTTQLAASRSGNLAVTSSSGGSFIYINDSQKQAWTTAVNAGDGGRGWNDIVYVSRTKGWVIYSPAGFFHGLGRIFRTRDSGHHWRAVTP